MNISKKQARRIILLHLNLLGPKTLEGKEGILTYVKKVGCIQFDPLSIIAMNSHLVLQSRIKSYKAEFLDELLYKDRLLMDGWDKNMAIFPIEDRPYFRRFYDHAIETHAWRDKNILDFVPIARELLDKGPITSKDLKFQDKIDWSWAPTSLSRAILDIMFFTGELMVDDKIGSRKSYGYTKNYLKSSLIEKADPNKTESKYFEWGVLRRIRASGILWNKASESFLGIKGLRSASRNKAFNDLHDQGILEKIIIDNINYDFYMDKADLYLIDEIENKYENRVSFIAPLDNLIWDRKLIKELFNFEYKWEVYTPEKDRKYGYYVLPILYGDQFIGRIEPVFDKKAKVLHIRGLWLEKYPIEEFKTALIEFCDFLGARTITYGDKTKDSLNWLKDIMA